MSYRGIWKNIIQRTENPNNPWFGYYGGRGIRLCPEWRASYEAFAAHLGPRPAGATVERIDNAKGYEPGNVRWASRREQGRNRRDNRMYEGVPLVVWCELFDVPQDRVEKRLRKGWRIARALTWPVRADAPCKTKRARLARTLRVPAEVTR